MSQIDLEKDIQPLSEFRATAAKFIKQVKKTKHPLILTQHGKSSVVLLDVGAYQSLIEKLELLQEIQIGEQQAVEGKYSTHEQVEQRLKNRYKK